MQLYFVRMKTKLPNKYIFILHLYTTGPKFPEAYPNRPAVLIKIRILISGGQHKKGLRKTFRKLFYFFFVQVHVQAPFMSLKFARQIKANAIKDNKRQNSQSAMST